MEKNFTRLIRLFLYLAIPFLLPPHAAAQAVYSTLYWPNFDLNGTLHPIESINVNGTGRTVVVPATSSGGPIALEVDAVGGKIYWFDQSVNNIRRANLDGTDVETFIADPNFASTLSIDPYHNKLYWPNFDLSGTLRQIERINFDGTGREVVVPQASVGEPIAIKVDGLRSKIYWYDQSVNSIRRANLDGTGVETFIASSGFVTQIDMDAVNGQLYWPNVDLGTATGYIERINVDGTGRTVVVPEASAVSPLGLTLDIPNGKIYWFNQSPFSILRANLDGTNAETFIADPGAPFNIIIPKQVSGTLPLRLLSFSAQRQANTVQLKWTTDAEVNTESFLIEKSSDARNFLAIGSLPSNAAGGLYQFTDNNVTAGHTYYYRLKMQDIGGAFTYSSTAQVVMGTGSATPGYSLFPNPVTGDELYLQSLSGDASPVQVKISDWQGRTIRQGTFTLQGDRFSVSVKDLPKGQYVLQVFVEGSGKSQSLKFVR